MNFLDATETYLPEVKIVDFYRQFGDTSKKVGEIVLFGYNEPVVYDIKLVVLTNPDSLSGVQKYCSY